jgi:hypothetical protein
MLASLATTDGTQLQTPAKLTVFYLMTSESTEDTEDPVKQHDLEVWSHALMTSLTDPINARLKVTREERQALLETVLGQELPALPPHLRAPPPGNCAETIPMVLASQWCGIVEVRTTDCKKFSQAELEHVKHTPPCWNCSSYMAMVPSTYPSAQSWVGEFWDTSKQLQQRKLESAEKKKQERLLKKDRKSRVPLSSNTG